MKHLNFCRQMVSQFTEEADLATVSQGIKQLKSHCIDLARVSHKFILPDGGRMYEDPEFKALDETTPLSLPFPLIAIEFIRSQEWLATLRHKTEGNLQPTKALLFAREREDVIVITVVVWSKLQAAWYPIPEVAISRTNYLDRSHRLNGYVSVILKRPTTDNVLGFEVPGADYMDEVGALLSMLNILNCKNVHIEKSQAIKSSKQEKKSALPFDSYHILTIDTPTSNGDGSPAIGHHRSPREHLRRGHIRRLSDGRRIWINATVVAAMRGAGVVTKDYKIRPNDGARP